MTRFTMSDLEIEKPDEPFEIETEDGSVYVLRDPKGLQLDAYLNLATLSSASQIAALLEEGQFEEFSKQPEMNLHYFEALMKQYKVHFGIPDPGEAAASLRSVKSTARPSKQTSRTKASA